MTDQLRDTIEIFNLIIGEIIFLNLMTEEKEQQNAPYQNGLMRSDTQMHQMKTCIPFYRAPYEKLIGILKNLMKCVEGTKINLQMLKQKSRKGTTRNALKQNADC